MGKPFVSELDTLPETYRWSKLHPVDGLASILSSLCDAPLVVVGSGGSLSAAHYAAKLHEHFTAQVARATTPLELITSPPPYEANILLLTASGNNKDVLQAFRQVVLREHRYVCALCATQGSPLSKVIAAVPHAALFAFSPPSGRDGFLATNSLVAMCTLLLRGYAQLADRHPMVPDIETNNLTLGVNGPLVAKGGMSVLASGWGLPVAYDIESKFTEAALGHVQIADFRNFGHGRHHWLAKRGEDTSVLLLETPETQALSRMTESLLPDGVLTHVIRTPHSGPGGTLDLMVQGFNVVHQRGKFLGIDPGRPGVPEFGRKLYHLGMPGVVRRDSDAKTVWVERKLRVARTTLDEVKAKFETGLAGFLHRLSTAKLGGIVFDFDGPLGYPSKRFGPLGERIKAKLIELLSNGWLVGVATGRGRSVQQSLQAALPRSLWGSVLIGYYSGALVQFLDAEIPQEAYQASIIWQAFEAIATESGLHEIANITVRQYQVTLEWRKPQFREYGLRILLNGLRTGPIKLVTSDHSVDLLPHHVSKLSVVRALEEHLGGRGVLAVGDRGNEGGNDYELLATPLSLSVDLVSSDPNTCWNLSPQGIRYVDATMVYLSALLTGGSVDVELLRRKPRAP